MRLARQYRPDAVTLDLILPDADGWQIADQLKADPDTTGIPVHVISIRDRPDPKLHKEIASYTPKPADVGTLTQVFVHITHHMGRPIRALLVVEQDPLRREAILGALKDDGVELDAVSSAAEALSMLRSRPYHGVVLDLDLPDMDGIALLREIRNDPALADIPTVVYTDHPLDPADEEQLVQLDAAIVAENGRSLARLKAEAEHFLRRVRTGLLGENTPIEAASTSSRGSLQGKKVLLVDDDVRNLFALTGMLESHGMDVITAENGRDAIARLEDESGIDLVLMDIMMPEMDGYQTMQQIRSNSRFKDLPVIALTANAMKGDREKCLAAGASDYASKPVDSEALLAQLRGWLSK
jgi:CheY-like chemotaxis protein